MGWWLVGVFWLLAALMVCVNEERGEPPHPGIW